MQYSTTTIRHHDLKQNLTLSCHSCWGNPICNFRTGPMRIYHIDISVLIATGTVLTKNMIFERKKNFQKVVYLVVVFTHHTVSQSIWSECALSSDHFCLALRLKRNCSKRIGLGLRFIDVLINSTKCHPRLLIGVTNFLSSSSTLAQNAGFHLLST